MDNLDGVFRHLTLIRNSSMMRLMIIQPAAFDQPINCSIQNAELDDCPTYEALSYKRGDPTTTLPIVLDGLSFQVPANLEAALRHLRLPEKTRVLWAGAICVNFNDHVENSQQDKRIVDIYRKSKKVLVWIGKEDDDLQETVEHMEKRSNKSSVREAFTFAAWCAMFLSGHKRYPFRSIDVFMSEADREALFKLHELMRRKWFKGDWALQEVTPASEVDIVCGSRSIPWDMVCRVPSCFKKAEDRNPIDHSLYVAPFAALEGIQLCREEGVSKMYNYSSLQDRNRFRLLILEPSPDQDAKISCSLLHRAISDQRPYEALSYTWGNEEADLPIFIEGSVFRVRRNLYSALRQLRYDNEPRVLWIDAICINQSDVDEQGQQVSQMDRIYSNAQEVAIWLGEASDQSDLGMDYIKEILNVVYGHLMATQRGDTAHSMADSFNSLLSRSGSDTCLFALASLLLSPWWDRVWTVQEIALARRAKVYCGSKTHEWFYFEALSKFFLMPDVYNAFVSHAVRSELGLVAVKILRERTPRPSTIKRIREGRGGKDGITLASMVKRTINHNATDPRDKIYGLLGVVTKRSVLEPNYKLTTSKVYTAAFKAILQDDNDLSTFYLIDIGNNSKVEELPSWVPDLSASRKLLTISQGFDERVGPVYSASSPKRRISEVSMEFQEEDRVLVLKGVAVDTINCLGDAAPDMRFAAAKGLAQSLKPTLLSWRSLLVEGQTRNYVTGCTTNDAFWRTVTLDQKVQGYHPGYGLQIVGRDRRLGNQDAWIPPPSLEREERLVTALDKQAGGIGGAQFNRKAFTTLKGYMGLAPPSAQVGDLVCVLLGAEVPHLLRPIQGGYHRMGECYLHGIMDGEVIEGAEKGDYRYQSFVLK